MTYRETQAIVRQVIEDGYRILAAHQPKEPPQYDQIFSVCDNCGVPFSQPNPYCAGHA